MVWPCEMNASMTHMHIADYNGSQVPTVHLDVHGNAGWTTSQGGK